MRKSRLLGAVCACIIVIITTTTKAAVLPLDSRLGGLAYYDPNLNITWAMDAGINGSDTWDNQMTWVADLTIGGVSGWRLPNMDVNGNGIVEDVNGTVGDGTDNEMFYLYQVEGISTSSPGPFINVGNSWSSTNFVGDPFAWFYSFSVGISFPTETFQSLSAWAVHDGDVGVVPIPATAWIFGSGLLGLIGVARRKRA